MFNREDHQVRNWEKTFANHVTNKETWEPGDRKKKLLQLMIKRQKMQQKMGIRLEPEIHRRA